MTQNIVSICKNLTSTFTYLFSVHIFSLLMFSSQIHGKISYPTSNTQPSEKPLYSVPNLSKNYKYTYVVYHKDNEQYIIDAANQYAKGYIPPKFISLKLDKHITNDYSLVTKLDIVELQRIELVSLKRKNKKLKRRLDKAQDKISDLEFKLKLANQTIYDINHNYMPVDHLMESQLAQSENIEVVLPIIEDSYTEFKKTRSHHHNKSQRHSKKITDFPGGLNPKIELPLPTVEEELKHDLLTDELNASIENLDMPLTKYEKRRFETELKSINLAEKKATVLKSEKLICENKSAFCSKPDLCHNEQFKQLCCAFCLRHGFDVSHLIQQVKQDEEKMSSKTTLQKSSSQGSGQDHTTNSRTLDQSIPIFDQHGLVDNTCQDSIICFDLQRCKEQDYNSKCCASCTRYQDKLLNLQKKVSKPRGHNIVSVTKTCRDYHTSCSIELSSDDEKCQTDKFKNLCCKTCSGR